MLMIILLDLSIYIAVDFPYIGSVTQKKVELWESLKRLKMETIHADDNNLRCMVVESLFVSQLCLRIYVLFQLSFVKVAVGKIGAFTCYYLCKCPTYSSQTCYKALHQGWFWQQQQKSRGQTNWISINIELTNKTKSEERRQNGQCFNCG